MVATQRRGVRVCCPSMGLAIALLAAICLIGACKDSASTSTGGGGAGAKGGSAAGGGGAAAKAEPLPADDPASVAALRKLEADKQVRIVRDGDHIVELDLTNVLDNATSSKGGTKNELALCKGLPGLKKLVATGTGITDEAAKTLQGHPRLQSLQFIKRSALTDEGVTAISKLPKLSEVVLEKSEVTDVGLRALATSKTIRYIRVPRTRVTDDGIAALSGCPELVLLDVLECTGVSSKSLETIGKLTKLRKLRLWGAGIRDEALPQLRGLTKLEELSLQYCRVGDEGLKNLEGLTMLRSLDLYGTAVTDKSWPMLAKLTQLQELRIRETGIRGEANVDSLAAMQKLKSIDLSESPVQDGLLAALAALPMLEEINLWNTQVSPEGVKVLGNSKSLKDINLDNLVNINDDSVAPLATIPTLEVLFLGKTSVTDATLVVLAEKASNLKRLTVKKTDTTKGGKEKFKAARPDVELITK
jgi:Leucine-rich repeat (LRR) protein